MSTEPTTEELRHDEPIQHFLSRGQHLGHRWTRVGAVAPGVDASLDLRGRDTPREVLYCETDHKIVIYQPTGTDAFWNFNEGHTLGPHEAVIRGEAAAGISGSEFQHDGHSHHRVGTIAHRDFGTASVWYCGPINNLMVDAKT